MRRRLLTILILLLAGAVVNVAVAWGCAAWGDVPRTGAVALETTPGNHWRVLRMDQTAATFFYVERVKDPTIDWSYTSEPPPSQLEPSWTSLSTPSPESRSADSERTREVRHIVAFGWPLRAVWCESRGSLVRDGGVPSSLRSQGGYIETGLVPLPGDSPRVLPLRPIWSGFAVNTLSYATLLWLLILGPFALRRFLRIRRGLCPKCAYPMGESAVCSECGKPLPEAS